jgi:DNA-binding HxlR family transcriptional regulator
MKTQTIEDIIYAYLKKHRRWCFGGELERIPCPHKPSTISRVLRAMAEEDLIYKTYEKVGKVRVVKYKAR